MRTLFLDTETTGLRPPYDEVVELALLDEHGEPLIDTLVRPSKLKSWPDAQRIHGIAPEHVRDAPTLDELVEALVAHLAGNRLVIYNAGYDMRFLPKVVQSAPAEVRCAMLEFAEYYGDWNEYRQSYRWQKLDLAAAHLGHVWRGKAHRASADAHACRSVWQFLELNESARQLAVENPRRCAECDNPSEWGIGRLVEHEGRVLCYGCSLPPDPPPDPSDEIPF